MSPRASYRLLFALAAVAVALTGVAAHAAPVVTFDLADVPATAIPGSEVHTLSLRYAIAGSDLRDVRVAIDLPANVIPVGAAHDARFTGGCEYDSAHDPLDQDRTQDWRCAWDASVLDVPEGGLSGQIALSVIYRRWGFGKGDIVTFAPTFDASWDDGGVPTPIAPHSTLGTTTIDGAIDAAFGYMLWDLQNDYAYVTLPTSDGPVTGLLLPLWVEVVNRGTTAIAEGARIELDLPEGMVFARARKHDGYFEPASGTVAGATGTIALVTTQTLGLARANPAPDAINGEVYGANYLEYQRVFAFIDVVVPCDAMPTANDAIVARLRGIAPGIHPTETVLDSYTSPPPLGEFAVRVCGLGAHSRTSQVGATGVSQRAEIVSFVHGPTGVVPVYDAFGSTYFPPPLRLTGAHIRLTWMGAAGSAADSGFELYACELPGVTTPITRAEFEDTYQSACTLLPLNFGDVPAGTTHLVAYGQSDQPWSEDGALGETTWMPLVLDGFGVIDVCMEGSDETTINVPSYAEAFDGDTMTWGTSVHELVAGVTHWPSWVTSPNPATVTRGQHQSLRFEANGWYAPLRNPVVTVPVPDGVVIEAVRPAGQLPGCVPPPLHWSITAGVLTITNGDDLTPWYHDNSCYENQCHQGGYLTFMLDLFFPADYPFLNGQSLAFAAALSGENQSPYAPTSVTETVTVTMQVPGEQRLVLEPACLDDNGTLLTGVRTRAMNTGGVPLTNVVIDLPLPKKNDGSGTQVDTVLAYVTSVYGPITCSTDGVTYDALTCNNPATTDVRVVVPRLEPRENEVVSVYFAPDPTAAPGAAVRHRASLTSNELLPIHTPPGPPARWGRCPGEVALDGWFDDGATPGVRESSEPALENWQVTFTDASDPSVTFDVTLPADGRLGFMIGAGTYVVKVTAPSADADAVWSFAPALPPSVTVTSSGVAEIDFGASCACDDGDECTIDSCNHGVCGHSFDDQNPECQTWCGDGVVEGDETCDNGVLYDLLDGCLGCGCSMFGFHWDEAAHACRPNCGDSHLFGDEACDDGNLVAGDGCDGNCQIESGWQCTRPTETCPPASVCGATPAAWCTYADPNEPWSSPNDWCADLRADQIFPFCGRTLDCQAVDRGCLDNPTEENVECFYDVLACDVCVALGPSTCTPACTASAASDATCDGVDDDCDGTADDDFVAHAVGCGRGACAAQGLVTCVGGAVRSSCVPGAPTTETCDGFDDDCDGATDEDFVLGAACTSGLGACAATGVTRCDGSGGTGCSAQAGKPGAERCNGLDDDCDGATDAVIADGGVVVCAPIETEITSGPAALTSATRASFTYRHPGDPAHDDFACALDGAPFTPCRGGALALVGLADGMHTLRVRTVRGDGAVDPTPAEHRWVVDTRAPDTFVVTGPAALSGASDAAFTFGASLSPVAYFCALDPASTPPPDVAWASCAVATTWTALADGRHVLWVYAVSAAGVADPSPATHAWDVDTSLPDTVIDAAPTAAPGGLSADDHATFELSDPTAPARDTFQCRLDDGAWAPCAGSVTYEHLADGDHTFAAYAVNAVGAVDPEPATWSWSVDATPPETFIVSGPSDPSASGAATFVLDSDEAEVTFACALVPASATPTAADFVPCERVAAYADLADGALVMWARATDAAGNSDATPASWRWTVDTSVPDTAIDGGPASPAAPGEDAVFSYECASDPAVDTFECRLDDGVWQACDGGTWTIDGATLDEGEHVVEVRACVEPGHRCDATPARHTWTVADACAHDAVPPTIICQPDARFECVAGGAEVDLEALVPRASDACGAVDVTYDAPDKWTPGARVLTFTATDASGNVASCTTEITVGDSTAPTIDCAPSLTRDAPADACAFEGTLVAPVSDACEGTSEATRSVALAVGQHDVTFEASDAAGHSATCTSALEVRDVTAPEVSCGTPTVGLPRVVAASASDACGALVSVSGLACRVGGAALAACPVAIDGARVTIEGGDPRGPLEVSWTVTATDPSGHAVSVACDETVTIDPVRFEASGGGGCGGASSSTGLVAVLVALAAMLGARRARAGGRPEA